MRKQNLKIIISFVITFSLIGSQAVLPSRASAGNQLLNYNNPNSFGTVTKNFTLSLKNITPGILTSVVSCTGIENKVNNKLIKLNNTIQTGLNNLLKKGEKAIGSLLTSKAKRVAAEKTLQDAKNKVNEALAASAVAAGFIPFLGGIATGLQTSLDAVNALPQPTAQQVTLTPEEQKTAQNAEKAKLIAASDVKAQNQTTECLNGIAVRLAKNELTSFTRNTMNWVNTGFNGDPMYVQDVSSFMDSITNNILDKETSLFKDSANSADFPYGRTFAQGAISANQAANDFAGSMKQDLTDYLTPGSTPASFATDFSQGGWDGWLALTQHSQNNPLGFTSSEAQHLADEQAKAVQQTTDEINRNGGYLDQKQCVEYEKPSATSSINPYGAYSSLCSSITPQNKAFCQSHAVQAAAGTAPKCIRYATVTPGSTIKDKVSTYINSPEQQLSLVKTMDDALNALFTSLIGQFENQGLAGLRSQVNTFTTPVTGGFGTNQVIGSDGTSLSAITAGSTTSSGTSTGDGYFDLTKDLGNTYDNGQVIKEGVIQIQFDFIDALNKSMAIAKNVLPSLGKLDYCIPGPNQNWQSNSQDALNAYLDSITANNTTFSASDGGQNKVNVTTTGPNTPIYPSTIDTTMSTYANLIDSTYGPSSPMQDSSAGNTSYLPMASEGLSLTSDLATYADTINTAEGDYQNTLAETNANIARLKIIKDQVNAIMLAAQKRRAIKRAQEGLPAIPQSCLTTERVTYLDNGVIK